MPPGLSNEQLSALRAEKDFGKKIAAMVILFGLDALRDHRRFLGLLEDFHPGEEAKGDRHLLRVALEQGIASGLLFSPPSPAERKRMENRLTDLFIAPEHAGRIVEQLERAIQEARQFGMNAASKIGDQFTVPGVGIDMLWIPPGEFLMGSLSSEEGRSPDEGPQIRVCLTQGFWLGKYPVTQAQWMALMGKNPSRFADNDTDAPVEKVSWNDAMEFAHKLTEREREAGRLPEGYAFTLPSEAQWEFACRAGTETRFNTGDADSDLARAGWFGWKTGDAVEDVLRAVKKTSDSRGGNADDRTHAVGRKAANNWGLHEMHGNVWEWTNSWYGIYLSDDGIDYEGPPSGSRRLLRGGSWDYNASNCRSASRRARLPNIRSASNGFRIALREISNGRSGAANDSMVDVSKGAGVDLVWISSGEFTMGSPADEPGRSNDEGPQTTVKITRGFWLGTTPVTVGQWRAVMGTDLREQARKAFADETLYNVGGKQQKLRDLWKLPPDADPMTRIGAEDADLPMHYLNWEEAKEFCCRLTERERWAGRLPKGYEFTLPTESQWEYAARAGTTAATYAGPMEILGRRNAPVLDAIASYGGNSSVHYTGRGWNTENWEEKQYPGGIAGPCETGFIGKSNAWGLFDMLGNVFEWTESWYGRYPGGKVEDYTGPASGTVRVIRGGSWASPARSCRCAARSALPPSFRNVTCGFRIALQKISDDGQGGSNQRASKESPEKKLAPQDHPCGNPGKVIAAMPVRAARMNCSPFFPLRAIDGGRFTADTPKPADGPWFYEPKVNGYQVLVHLHDDGSIDIWNQYGQWLSIFEKLDFTQFRLLLPPGYYDCELIGPSCGAMRGHIVVIDVPDFGGTWRSMKTWLRDKIPNLLGLKTPFENHGRRNLWILPDVGEFRADGSPIVYPDDHLFVKEHLQLVNVELGVDFYEGFVAKNPVLKYMRQPTDSTKEHPGWIQYRF